MSVNKWKIKANALLDDPSTRTYLNSLNSIILAVLKGRLRALTVNVENDNQEMLGITVVEFMISNSDGKVSQVKRAYTAERVTGNMQVFDLSKH